MRRKQKILGQISDEQSLKRKEARKEGKCILVVCEGTKTEPGYFKALRNKWGLKAARVEVVDKGRGTDPISVVDDAIELRDEAEKEKNPFDEVWCVFDREGTNNKSKTFEPALQKAKSEKLRVALSVPCFEIWYLRHFTNSAKPFNMPSEVIKELKKQEGFSKYEKSKDYTHILEPLTAEAIKNAKTVSKSNKTGGATRNATDVDLLVKSMQSMRRNP